MALWPSTKSRSSGDRAAFVRCKLGPALLDARHVSIVGRPSSLRQIGLSGLASVVSIVGRPSSLRQTLPIRSWWPQRSCLDRRATEQPSSSASLLDMFSSRSTDVRAVFIRISPGRSPSVPCLDRRATEQPSSGASGRYLNNCLPCLDRRATEQLSSEFPGRLAPSACSCLDRRATEQPSSARAPA